jgi:micrococcal nuclease
MRSFTFPARQSLILLAILILLTASALAADKDYGDRTQARPALERVSVPLAIIDVGDGDTVTLHWNEEDTERVRILGIDTPEVAHPRWGQYLNQPFGTEAAAFAAGAFAAASEVQLIRAAETDGYGRTLGYFS